MRFFEQKKTLKPDDLSVLRSLAALLAEWTGFEPATPCVTGTYSNQLNYHSVWDGKYTQLFLLRKVFFKILSLIVIIVKNPLFLALNRHK